MTSRPILPATLAWDSILELRGFVAALLYARKLDTSNAILKCLFEDDPMIKGPFVQLSRPFVKASSGEWPLDPLLQQKFAPYSHQLNAYRRLSGDAPKHTIVTTGTGSGKSECFILPVLDYVLKCKRQGKKDGVKALVIYPMNALIEDQGERLGELTHMLNNHLGSDEKIRIGRYTGAHGTTTEHDANNPRMIINDRDTLCARPPDVLLTNYRMLDFMLFRPEEQSFWSEATKDVFRYLVLDELHTFDGAQGADVACLIRRLRLKLAADFTCIGTSATVAGGKGKDPLEEKLGLDSLCAFATTLFGANIGRDAVLQEDRVAIDEFLTTDPELYKPSGECASSTNLLHDGADQYEAYIAERCQHWRAPVDPVARGVWVKSHPLTRKLIKSELRGLDLYTLAQRVELSTGLLIEYLDLAASARESIGGRLGPVLPIQVQIWVSETNSLLRKLSNTLEFRRLQEDEGAKSQGYLPAINCRTCGLSGWLAKQIHDGTNQDEFFLEWDTKAVKQAYHDKSGIILFPRTKDDKQTEGRGHFYYDPVGEKLHRGSPETTDSEGVLLNIAFLSQTVQKQMTHTKKSRHAKNTDLDRCPVCDSTLSLSMSGVGTSMLGSVLTNVFLAHGANPDDRKCLIFNDSVQDAAHQAGYIGARGFRFNVRRYLYRMAEAVQAGSSGRSITYQDMIAYLRADLEQQWRAAMKNNQTAKLSLMQIMPKDLWELWRSKASVSMPLNTPANLEQLVQRLAWEFWLELTLHADLGWSLRKTEMLALTLKEETFAAWVEAAQHISAKLQYPLADYQSFVQGLAERLLTQGAIEHDDLKECYAQKKFGTWHLTNQHQHLAALFGPKSARPNVLNLTPHAEGSGRQHTLNLISEGRTWFERWTVKHRATLHKQDGTLVNPKPPQQFLLNFVNALANSNQGLKFAREGSDASVILAQDATHIVFAVASKFQCQSCDHIDRVYQTVSCVERPCTQYLCAGMMTKMDASANSEHEQFSGYLGRQYRRSIVAPFPHSHTGQMKSEDRRRVEQAFKRNLLPGDSINENGQGAPYYKDHPVNVLACTPSLEMGIDIGSLSGVVLRGFPKSLANTLQRIGRSGRSSGNSFNTVLVTRRPHDTYHWRQPQHVFEGSVKSPGCHFRTKDVLKRQFHAHLLDLYAITTNGISFPRDKDMVDGAQFLTHPFWAGFKDFLQSQEAKSALSYFMESVKLGDHAAAKTPYGELLSFLGRALSKDGLWAAIESVLKEQDFRRAALQSALQKAPQLDEQTDEGQLDSEGDVHEAEAASDTLEAQRQKEALQMRYQKTASAEYTLKLLADRGILPNYAYPEEGISFTSTISIPIDRLGDTSNRRNKNVRIEITRPSPIALTELAPGKSFYVDGFKIPIARIAKPMGKDTKALQKKLICQVCGTVSSAGAHLKIVAAQCPACGAQDQDIANVITPQEIHGGGTFADLQIRDSEEEREKGLYRLETLINYTNTEEQGTTSQYATWLSPSEAIAFEFRTNAEINFLVRGENNGGTYQYFDVCSECWAIPYRKEGDLFVFKELHYPKKLNRHMFFCSSYRSPNAASVKVIKIALGKTIHSDAIRFFSNSKEFLPTLQALLSLTMRLRLGGDPSHIGVLTSFLKTPESGIKVVATLYDRVPGGTGHLTALMPMVDDKLDSRIGGLEQLKEAFKETQRFLKNCPCKEGCYDCLYTYTNQFSHELITKIGAINWIGRFLRAGDWNKQESALAVEIANNALFDNSTESDFLDGMAHRQPGIPGIKKVLNMPEDGNKACILIPTAGDDHLVLVHTPDDKVYLNTGSIPYTKPDFTLWKNSSIVGYIYADGRDPHLNPDEEISTFEATDIHVRKALLTDKLGTADHLPSMVLTYSTEMIAAWTAWLRKVPKESLTDTRALAMQSIDRDGVGHKIHALTCVLAQTLDPSLNLKIDPEDCRATLYATFISHTLGQAFGTVSEPYFNAADRKLLQALLQEMEDGRSFGGLTLVRGSPSHFRMNADVKSRIDKEGRISRAYRESWELFWILWQIDRTLVDFVDAPKKNLDRPKHSLPHGYADYLTDRQRFVVDWLFSHRSGVEHILKDVVGCPDDACPPFALKAGHYAFYDEQSLVVRSSDMPAKLLDGTLVFVIDLDTVDAQTLDELVPNPTKGAA